MELIARGQPRAKLDDTREVIELRIPTGDREKIVFDLTPNQAMLLEQYLRREVIAFFTARREAQDWRDENVLAFPFDRVRRA
jgi:hypothetical protein